MTRSNNTHISLTLSVNGTSNIMTATGINTLDSVTCRAYGGGTGALSGYAYVQGYAGASVNYDYAYIPLDPVTGIYEARGMRYGLVDRIRIQNNYNYQLQCTFGVRHDPDSVEIEAIHDYGMIAIFYLLCLLVAVLPSYLGFRTAVRIVKNRKKGES